MAGPGYTFVEGINELVETIGEFPMTGSTKPSAASDTSSVYYLAEKHIDRYNKRVQAQGWPENTVFSKSYTPSTVNGVANVVSLSSSVLKIQASGTSEGRPLVIRVDTADSDTPKIFDPSLNSFNLGSTSAVFVDQVELLDFDNLPPQLQDVILTEAKGSFQRMLQGNLNLDSTLVGEQMKADVAAPRITFDARRSFNETPSQPQAQQRERSQ